MNMKHFALTFAVATLAACSSAPTPQDTDRLVQSILKSSFREQGIAKLDRLTQDELQTACSSDTPPTDAVAKQLEAAQLATVQWPTDGAWLGDWREGEKLAQNGRGGTWSDPPGAPAGGNCYNCHQLAAKEIAYGTIGPSLLHFGKIRGTSEDAMRYTYGRIYNVKAYNLCANMPRFGHMGILTEAQIKDLVALLLDPASPVNK